MNPATRRAFLVGATVAAASVTAIATTAAPGEPEPIIALVAEWEPLYRAATKASANLKAAGAEMQRRGFSDYYEMILFGPSTVWESVAEIEAYYAPMIAMRAAMATETRDRYIAKFRVKMAAREELGVAAIEEASHEAWACAEEIEDRILTAPASTLAGIAAKARYALLNMIVKDGEDELPGNWPPQAVALGSALDVLERMAPPVG